MTPSFPAQPTRLCGDSSESVPVFDREINRSVPIKAGNHRAATPRLWLALYLPRFPLEVLGAERAAVRPVAVISATGAGSVVVAVATNAESAGVHVGMSASAACVLVPNLMLVPHDETAEGAALEGLAAWAGQFTSFVSLVPPHGLLLEIGGSLALFGGLDALLARVRQAIGALGYSVHFGVAPTPPNTCPRCGHRRTPGGGTKCTECGLEGVNSD